MINIALYKPDIPQNTAAIVRLSACLNLRIHIIEPCGFNLDDSRFKRVAMDYVKLSEITRYSDFENFKNKNNKSRIILLTTKAKKFYHEFKFKKMIFYCLVGKVLVFQRKFILHLMNLLKFP